MAMTLGGLDHALNERSAPRACVRTDQLGDRALGQTTPHCLIEPRNTATEMPWRCSRRFRKPFLQKPAKIDYGVTRCHEGNMARKEICSSEQSSSFRAGLRKL